MFFNKNDAKFHCPARKINFMYYTQKNKKGNNICDTFVLGLRKKQLWVELWIDHLLKIII